MRNQPHRSRQLTPSVGQRQRCCGRKVALLAIAFGFAAAVCAASTETGIRAFADGRYSDALKQLQPEADRGDATARAYIALVQAASGHCDTSLPGLRQQASSGAPTIAKLSGIAAVRCYASSHQYAEAIPIAESLKQRFPDDADVLYLAAETEMSAFNDTTFQMFQKTPSSYRVHELSARIFEVQNRYGDAVAEYKKALELNPNAPDLHFRLGRALLLQSHSPEALDQAAAAFQAESKVSPEDSACQFQLGQIAQVRGQTAEARRYFERALQLSPDFVSALIALAGIDSREQQYAQAIPLLLHAVQLQPANEAAHYSLLTAYRNAGQMDKARQEKAILDRLQKPPEGEFSDFLKKLGDGQPQP